MKRLLNVKYACICVCILFILSLIPLLAIARYDHPCADDFSYGVHTVGVWRDTGSLPRVLDAAAEGTRTVYNTWQGSFAAVFLMTLHPAVFGGHLYALAPIGLILVFIACALFLLKVVLVDYFGADKYRWLIVSLVLIFLSMQFVHSPVEAFYWYNGAVYYTGFYSLSMLLFALLLLSVRENRRGARIALAVPAVILAFLTGGGNLVTALTSVVILLLLTVYRAVRKSRVLIPLLALLAICAGLLINASAPGNAIRQQFFRGTNPILSILLSFWYVLRYLYYFNRVTVLIGLACITPALYGAAAGSTYSFRLPGLATAVFYAVFASSFTPNIYAMSSFGPARVVNVNFYLYLLFLPATIFYWCGWIARKFPASSNTNAGRQKRPPKPRQSIVPGMTALLTACFLFACVFVTSGNPDAMASVSASRSLLSGEAKRYHDENLSREALYADPLITAVELEAFTVRPHVLFFDDVTTDVNEWQNTALASYYGKESVRIVN